MQGKMELLNSILTCIPDGHQHRVIIPDFVLIQLSSWGWAHSCSKHIEDWNKYIIEEIVRQVDYLPEFKETATSGQASAYLYCSVRPNCESRQSEVVYNISKFYRISTLYNLQYWQPRNVNRTKNNWPDMGKLHDEGVSFRTTLSAKRIFCKIWIPGFGNEAHLLTASPFDLLVSSNGKFL
jgi:hypothetical protein